MGAATWGEEGQFSLSPKSVLREGAGGSGKPSISSNLLTIPLAEAGHLFGGAFCALWRITEVRGAENRLPRVCPASPSLPVSPYKHVPAEKSAPQQRLGMFLCQEEPSHEDFGVRAAVLLLSHLLSSLGTAALMG